MTDSNFQKSELFSLLTFISQTVMEVIDQEKSLQDLIVRGADVLGTHKERIVVSDSDEEHLRGTSSKTSSFFRSHF